MWNGDSRRSDRITSFHKSTYIISGVVEGLAFHVLFDGIETKIISESVHDIRESSLQWAESIDNLAFYSAFDWNDRKYVVASAEKNFLLVGKLLEHNADASQMRIPICMIQNTILFFHFCFSSWGSCLIGLRACLTVPVYSRVTTDLFECQGLLRAKWADTLPEMFFYCPLCSQPTFFCGTKTPTGTRTVQLGKARTRYLSQPPWLR